MGPPYSTLKEGKGVKDPVVAKALDNIKNNVTINSTQTCEANNNNIQTFSIGQINAENCDVEISGMSQKINTKVNATCVQNNGFKELVDSAIKLEVESLKQSGKPNVAEQIRNITNDIDLNKVTSCMANLYNTQNMNFAGFNMTCPRSGKLTIKNISQEIASDMLFTCAQDQSPDVVEKLDNIRVPVNEKVDVVAPTSDSISTEKIISASLLFVVLLMIFIIVIIVLVRKPNTN